ncbi:MAG: hypothetical protein EOS85_29225, partial [Mesorhizobium sp.]
MDPRPAFSRGAQAELIGSAFSYLSVGSIQIGKGSLAMHPIKHLFEDIYRNYWGISPATDRP